LRLLHGIDVDAMVREAVCSLSRREWGLRESRGQTLCSACRCD
jgi:hypothetical protein